MTPRIHLAVDNCFAYKRWTRPDAWARVVSGLGVSCVEASADTELDPLYVGPSYLETWLSEVRRAEEAHGVRVCNLYSGHGTYTTLGLTHTDAGVRERMVADWFYPMIRMAGELRCGIGFFAHGFEHRALQRAEDYAAQVELLLESLTRLNRFAGQVKCGRLAVEQMYTPHMYPWRLGDTEELLRQVTARSGRDFYFTEDVGHHQAKFLRPKRSALTGRPVRGVWLGTDRAFALADAEGAAAWDRISAEMDANPQLFSCPEDADCYAWLERLGCYSPIVHLQQTDGRSSPHHPFTAEHNRDGRITGEQVLRALQRSYQRPVAPHMPARCDEIYLTLEVFSSTVSIPHDLLQDYRESVRYWRRFVPRDGLTLDELVASLPANG
ncbi:MAG TPA: TIM barrel protein [Anaeromyxobacter sp.]|nr:TIM barrel protein [Anaeromyxobacter sp.]